MSALNLLRAYRYPQVAACATGDLTPERFLDGRANTIYVVAAGHDQEALRPVILALVAAMYEAAIVKARRTGALDPRLFILMDEAANIAPVRNLAPWLSQCGDHGIVIATIWQSIAQIDQRYGRAARDAICAASTAQVFIPPLAEPTSAGYLTELLGEEPVANASTSTGLSRHTLSVGHQKAGPSPWLRQIGRGRAILVYRDLPPAIVRAPGWFEDPGSRTTRGGRSVAAELIGLVVAQEPPVGGELARNGMVTLYVAAPGLTPTMEDAGGRRFDLAVSPAAAAQGGRAQADAPQEPRRRAPARKPGLADVQAPVFDVPPAPIAPAQRTGPSRKAAVRELDRAEARGAERQARYPGCRTARRSREAVLPTTGEQGALARGVRGIARTCSRGRAGEAARVAQGLSAQRRAATLAGRSRGPCWRIRCWPRPPARCSRSWVWSAVAWHSLAGRSQTPAPSAISERARWTRRRSKCMKAPALAGDSGAERGQSARRAAPAFGPAATGPHHRGAGTRQKPDVAARSDGGEVQAAVRRSPLPRPR